MTYLRRIAIHVDEPDPGDFFWVLMESTEDITVWTELEASEGSYRTWMEAFEAGNAHVMFLTEDLDLGPRGPGSQRTPARSDLSKPRSL